MDYSQAVCVAATLVSIVLVPVASLCIVALTAAIGAEHSMAHAVDHDNGR